MERDPNFQSMPNGFVYCQKLLQPQGESRSEEWVWSKLAKLLGVLDNYFPILNSYSYDTWDQMWVAMCKKAYETWAATDAAKALNPPSWDDFVKKPVMRWDNTGTPTFAFKSEIVDAKGFTTTSSGKIQAYNDTFAKGTDYLKTTKYGGYLDPYPAYNYPLQFGGYHEANMNDRPLVLMTTQPKYHTHSWMTNNPWLKNELVEHSVQLSVPDAKARGIVDGDMVSVIGDMGTSHMRATVTSRLVPGTVHIWKGTYYDPDPNSGFDKEGCINALQFDKACAAKTYANMTRVQVVKE
jgi:anaerobic dimethyl sulfoxide reductase subunit A